MTARFNEVWGVVLRGGSFILQRNGKDYRVYQSARELWDQARPLMGKVDPLAFNRLFTLGRESHEESGVNSAFIEGVSTNGIKVGYWLHPEQLEQSTRRKEDNHVEHI